MSFWVHTKRPAAKGRWLLSINISFIVVLVLFTLLRVVSAEIAATYSWQGVASLAIVGSCLLFAAWWNERGRGIFAVLGIILLVMSLAAL